jgi:hypothetical protein
MKTRKAARLRRNPNRGISRHRLQVHRSLGFEAIEDRRMLANGLIAFVRLMPPVIAANTPDPAPIGIAFAN